ncbi:variant leucine-rich repeat-containing protein [Glutamicibacter halophytocola]|uniref:variant leucine-rich repeat-containing protein n=1 Tax=Glutamicibacter halophytocola TaxID=1933880 RepID=UPI0015C56455|nr:hypothetical protein [Glutamicibacter halophytocola]NQD42289.1 hypothetical protein [Glutamicibacter halophytocola]
MSLTDRLRDSSSPVRTFLMGISPLAAALYGQTGTARAAAKSLGFTDVEKSPALVPASLQGANATTGTAFDIRVRIATRGFDPLASASSEGISWIRQRADLIENGRHRAAVLTECFDVATSFLNDGHHETQLDLAAVLFAYCEQVFRGGINALGGQLGRSCDQAKTVQEFVANIDPAVLLDLRTLMNISSGQIELWKTQLAEGTRFEPNPDFAGSALVGGADGDWIVGDTLIDCKVYGQLSVPKLRDFLLQLLGYVMLDLDDALKIRNVGLWLPRQKLTPSWSLEYLLGGDPDILLPALRDEFIKATKPTQLALKIPVSQRRKHQLLADNWRTRLGMLEALGYSDDKDLRFRVGRNPSTPEPTVRLLAKDRYAKVREGVAMNEHIPADLLNILLRDSSMMVRRAAYANQRPSKLPTNALNALLGNAQPENLEDFDLILVNDPTVDFGQGVVEINQNRPSWALDTRWLYGFLSTVLVGKADYYLGSLVPEATRIWSRISGTPFRFPERLWGGLSETVKADLLGADRPALIRQLVARHMPVSDSEIRDQLLRDEDPKIRWSALQRTMNQTDESLSAFLNELSSSREARLKFREDNADSSYWSPTKAELDQQVIHLLAGHPATPRQVLKELIENKRPDVLLALAHNSALGAESLRELCSRMVADRSLASRKLFASSLLTPFEVLKNLGSDKSPIVRELLAENEQIPADVLTSLASDHDRSVRLAVLRNQKTPGSIAETIAKDLLAKSANRALFDVLNALDGRSDVHLSINLLEAALDELSKSRVRDPDMRCIVGRDPRAGENTLKRLSQSVTNEVRIAVAGNVSSPTAVLDLLAMDLASEVRAAVAENSLTSASTLLELCRDDSEAVRLAAMRNSKLTPEAMYGLNRDGIPIADDAGMERDDRTQEGNTQREVELASVPGVPRWTRDDLHEMAASPRAEVRISVAYKEETPADILKYLSGDRRSKKVRGAVAAHPGTLPEDLSVLCADKELEVHQAVALNPSTPAALLVELAGRSVDFALLVSLNPAAPDQLLDSLSSDGEALVRFVAEVAKENRVLEAGAQYSQLPAPVETLE